MKRTLEFQAAALLVIGLMCCLPQRVRATGSWFISGNPAPAAVGLMLLLPDGTVMAENHPSGIGYVWYRLTPDVNGHYVNGTWSSVAPMHDTRLFHSSQVLPDGRLFVAGGEYGSGAAKAEIYDPQADSWAQINPPVSLLNPTNVSPALSTNNSNGGLQGFYDSESMLLSDGKVLVGPVGPSEYGGTLIYNALSNSWSDGPKIYRGGYQDEASWVKLPDGSILTVDPFGTNCERYIPTLARWINDASVPVALYSPVGGEIGPALMLPNGAAFFLGGSGHTAIYTPSGTTNFGTWMVGPDIPGGLTAADAPATMMVNGRILCAVSGAPYLDGSGVVQFPSPTSFFEYDYRVGASGQFTQVNGPTGLTDNTPAYETAMLMLPDASVMFCDSIEQNTGAKLYFYYPDNNGQADLGHAPAVSGIYGNPDGSEHLVGTGLNGLSAGAAYGDNKQMDSNYPIVEFIDPNTGQISYARTFNWSSTGVQTGSAVESTDFVLPRNFIPKIYNVEVSASGVTSAPVAFSYVQPASLALCPGDNGNLTAFTPPEPATYQWLSNGIAIQGQISLILNFTSATTNQSAYYSLKVTTANGYTISPAVPVSVGVWVLGPPPPTNSATLCQPYTISFKAQGKGTLSAQWFRNGDPVNVSPGYGITTNELPLASGATQFTLSFSDVKYQDDGTYTVAITDDCVTTNFVRFTLRVVPNPPWVLVATNGPASRYQAAMAYDGLRHAAVLFGGQTYNPTGSPMLGDTWEFDGTNWTQQFPATSPLPRSQAQMVYDQALGCDVLFGGQIYTNNQYKLSLETWEWDGTNWTQIITPHVPDWTQPDLFSACYDNNTAEMLIFGGLNSTGRVSELWGFDGTDWTQKTPTAPVPVTTGNTLMAYDLFRGVAVLLGANSQAYPSPYQQAAVWEWDGSAWQEKPQRGQVFAGATALDGFVYDVFRHECVLYGNVFGIVDGVSSSSYTPFPDGYRFVWRWDGADWQADPPTPTTGVVQSLYPSMCFDFWRNTIDLFGGLSNGNVPVTNYTYEILYQDDPTVLKQPSIVARVIGQSVQLSTIVAGAPPISYQWSKDGVNLTDNGRITGSLTGTLTINSATVADSVQYLLAMNNVCGMGLSQPITLNVAAGVDILAIATSGTNSVASAQNFVITWGDASAALQSSTNLAGPWMTVSNTASPYSFTVNPGIPTQFFRLLIP